MPVPNSLKRILLVGTINICSHPQKNQELGSHLRARGRVLVADGGHIAAHQLDE